MVRQARQVSLGRASIWKRFERWHNKNPQGWDLFVRFANEAIAAGRSRFSAGTIVDRIRWYTNVEMKAVDEYKINNDWSACYARLFIRMYPQHKKLFALRGAQEDQETEDRLVAKIKGLPFTSEQTQAQKQRARKERVEKNRRSQMGLFTR